VLNYARVETGNVRYDVRDVSVDELLATCEALVAPQAWQLTEATAARA